MALDFPAGPALNQIYQHWQWDGAKWGRVTAAGDFVLRAGDTMSGALWLPRLSITPSGPQFYTDASYSYLAFEPTVAWRLQWNKSNGDLYWASGTTIMFNSQGAGSFSVHGGFSTGTFLTTNGNVWAGTSVHAVGAMSTAADLWVSQNLNGTAWPTSFWTPGTLRIHARGDFGSVLTNNGLVHSGTSGLYYYGRGSWDGIWRIVENNTENFLVWPDGTRCRARGDVQAGQFVYISTRHIGHDMALFFTGDSDRHVGFSLGGDTRFSGQWGNGLVHVFGGYWAGTLAPTGTWHIAGWLVLGSDAEKKQDIADYSDDDALADILSLRPRKYRRRYRDADPEQIYKMVDVVGPVEMGFTHQEVIQTRPEWAPVRTETGHKGVNTVGILAGAVGAIKQHEARLRAAEARSATHA